VLAIGGRLGVDRQTFIRRHKDGEQVVDLPANGTAWMRRFATGQS